LDPLPVLKSMRGEEEDDEVDDQIEKLFSRGRKGAAVARPRWRLLFGRSDQP
jgi:hypothetical protein